MVVNLNYFVEHVEDGTKSSEMLMLVSEKMPRWPNNATIPQSSTVVIVPVNDWHNELQSSFLASQHCLAIFLRQTTIYISLDLN